MPELKLERRDKIGKQIVKDLRRRGMIPGVYYSKGNEPIPVSVEEKALRAVIFGEYNLIDLNLENTKLKSVISEVQYDPVRGVPVHVDFMGIRMDEKINITVPIHLTGIADGVKNDGGIMQQILREIDVAALPLDLPDHIQVDVSELSVGDSIHVSDLMTGNFDILTEGDRSVVTIVAPTITKELEELEEAEEIGEEGEEVEGEEEQEESKEDEE